MKHINLNTNRICYPVGKNLIINLPIIRKMGLAILKLPLPEHKHVDLVCMGSSGAIIASIISVMLIKKGYTTQIVHIKKNGESSHNGTVSGLTNTHYNIVVDDFIDTGLTIKTIFQKVVECTNARINAICVSGLIFSEMIELIENLSVDILIYKIDK